MKKFKLFLIGMLAMVGMLATSCGSSDDNEQQDAHNEVSVTKMHELVENCKKLDNVKYAIIDYRSGEEYAAGHITGSKWVGVEGNNTTMGNGSFAKAVLKKVGNDTNTYIFLVGKANADLMMTLAGSVSSAGFGKKHTYILLGGYDAWVAAYPNEVE